MTTGAFDRHAPGSRAGAPAAAIAPPVVGPPRLDLLDHMFLVYALILRDLNLKFRTDGVGFSLDFLRPTLIVIGHYFLFWYLSRTMPGNMPIETFVIAGFSVIFGFILTVNGTVSAAKYPGGTILIPAVTRMHLRVAKASWALLSFVFLSLAGTALLQLFGDTAVDFPNLPLFVLVFVITGALAFGFGLVVEALTRLTAAAQIAQQIFTTLIYITSGIYFSLSTINPEVAAFFWYNPILHLVEYQRNAFDSGYSIAYASLAYPAGFAAGMLLLGLSVNRCMRHLDRE